MAAKARWQVVTILLYRPAFDFETTNRRYTAAKRTIIAGNKSDLKGHVISPDPGFAVPVLDRILFHRTT